MHQYENVFGSNKYTFYNCEYIKFFKTASYLMKSSESGPYLALPLPVIVGYIGPTPDSTAQHYFCVNRVNYPLSHSSTGTQRCCLCYEEVQRVVGPVVTLGHLLRRVNRKTIYILQTNVFVPQRPVLNLFIFYQKGQGPIFIEGDIGIIQGWVFALWFFVRIARFL